MKIKNEKYIFTIKTLYVNTMSAILSQKIVFCTILYTATAAYCSLHAQLSDLHYLPPLKQGRNNEGISQQAIHLSTPETTSFDVHIYRGTNTTPIATFTISNTSPGVYDNTHPTAPLTNGDNNITLVSNTNTGTVLTNSGLRLES
ncbi:MAG: hypothetical protein AAGA86_05760, partial [Bacteroidota bacterium]